MLDVLFVYKAVRNQLNSISIEKSNMFIITHKSLKIYQSDMVWHSLAISSITSLTLKKLNEIVHFLIVEIVVRTSESYHYKNNTSVNLNQIVVSYVQLIHFSSKILGANLISLLRTCKFIRIFPFLAIGCFLKLNVRMRRMPRKP